ncbi:MAG TPA: FAD-binding oxidoreductase [Candidatus Limnocylindrales bacterium]|nr:FAD-binding oxidoreductase [Candidatus Limnocylindrales bacterium]
MARSLIAPSPADQPKSADVIIVGGGPAGSAAAWALERAQPGIKVVLLERGHQPGSGASNASLENFRTAWAAPCLARLMTRSIDVFMHPEEYFGEGVDLGAKQRGYLWCAFTEAQAAKLRAEAEHLHAIGLTHVQYLDHDAVQARFGWLGPALIAGKYDPHAGWLDSAALIQAFLRACERTTVLLDVPKLRLLRERERISGVETPAGVIHAPAVLIAAGADSRAIAATANIDLPLVLRPRQSFTTGWRHAEFPANSPAIIGAAPFPHVRPEAQDGAIFGWEYAWNAKSADEQGRAAHELVEPVYPVDRWRDPRLPSMALMLLARQFGHADGSGFASSRYLRGIDHRAGYYVYRDASAAYTLSSRGKRQPYDSQRAILDAHPDIENLFLSIAHVGHGIMSAPAAGEIVAARILGRPLPDPVFADFAWNAHYVEHDSGGLTPD